MIKACFYCDFFRPDDLLPEDLKESHWDLLLDGICRRRPPRPGRWFVDQYGNEEQGKGCWPKVNATDWCGEYRQRIPLPVNDTESNNE